MKGGMERVEKKKGKMETPNFSDVLCHCTGLMTKPALTPVRMLGPNIPLWVVHK